MVLDRAWDLASQYRSVDGCSQLGGAVRKQKGSTEGEQKSLFRQNVPADRNERRNQSKVNNKYVL